MPQNLTAATTTFVALLCITPASSGHAIEFAKTVEHYAGGHIELVGTTRDFSCHQRIHAVFASKPLPLGPAALKFHWIGPTGKLEHQSEQQYRIVSKAQTINLARSIRLVQNRSSLISFVDPSSGFMDYIGQWTVKVYLNQELAAVNTFDVLC